GGVCVCVAFTLACLYAAHLKAQLKEMAPLLKTSSVRPPFHDYGLDLEESFWVDEKRSRRTTVREALIEAKASLRDGKVVDPEGRELFFLRILERRKRGLHDKDGDEHPHETIKGLKERGYRVIPMYGPMPKD